MTRLGSTSCYSFSEPGATQLGGLRGVRPKLTSPVCHLYIPPWMLKSTSETFCSLASDRWPQRFSTRKASPGNSKYLAQSYEVFSWPLGSILIWLYPEKASMKLRSSWPAVAFTIRSIRGRGKLSFGQARLTSVKSMQSRHLSFAFLRRTTLANQSGYSTSRIALA